jgi:glycosyltransferase involved in cell wall biosynthesis
VRHLLIDSFVNRVSAGPTVTFVGHDASRTGAPVMLCSFLRWLQAEGIQGVELALLAAGPLLSEYREVAPTQVLTSRLLHSSEQLSAVMSSLGHPIAVPSSIQGIGLRAIAASEIVVANTLASLRTARLLAERSAQDGKPADLVCHVHELDGVAERVLPASLGVREQLLSSVDRFAAASEAVAAMLVDRMGISASRVTVIEEFIEAPCPSSRAIAVARQRMVGEVNRPVILNVGAMSHRKGPERFVDLMSTLVAHPSLPIGVWLGGERGSSVWLEMEHSIAASALQDCVVLLASTEDSASYIAAADLVVSTAIEDPFPLSVLEAGAASKAVVSFESGGVIDMLRAVGHAELLLPIGDTLGMSAAVATLLDNPTNRKLIGTQLAEWVTATHLVEHIAPALWQVVKG